MVVLSQAILCPVVREWWAEADWLWEKSSGLKLSSMNRRVSLLKVPQYSLMTSKNNFHYKAASIWNKIMPKLLERPDLDANTNLVIPGSCLNSDLTTPMGYIKHKTKAILLNIQCLGDPIHWLSDRLNFTI